eukprot:gene16554-biopygen6329
MTFPVTPYGGRGSCRTARASRGTLVRTFTRALARDWSFGRLVALGFGRLAGTSARPSWATSLPTTDLVSPPVVRNRYWNKGIRVRQDPGGGRIWHSSYRIARRCSSKGSGGGGRPGQVPARCRGSAGVFRPAEYTDRPGTLRARVPVPRRRARSDGVRGSELALLAGQQLLYPPHGRAQIAVILDLLDALHGLRQIGHRPVLLYLVGTGAPRVQLQTAPR